MFWRTHLGARDVGTILGRAAKLLSMYEESDFATYNITRGGGRCPNLERYYDFAAIFG